MFENQGAVLLAQSDGCAVWQFRSDTGDGTIGLPGVPRGAAELQRLPHGALRLRLCAGPADSGHRPLPGGADGIPGRRKSAFLI